MNHCLWIIKTYKVLVAHGLAASFSSCLKYLKVMNNNIGISLYHEALRLQKLWFTCAWLHSNVDKYKIQNTITKASIHSAAFKCRQG